MGRDTRNKAAAQPATPAARKLSDGELAAIHDDTKRLDVRARIAYWDKRQAAKVYVDAVGKVLGEADKVERVVERGGLTTTEFGWPDGAKLVRDPAVILCPNDATHGPLTATSSGALLICGERRQGAVCTGSVPVSI